MGDKENINRKVNKVKFAQRLQEVIEEFNQTIYTIAEIIHMTPPTVSRYVNAIIAPKATTVEIIATHFGLNPAWLMGYDVDKYLPATTIHKNIIPLKTRKVPLLGEIVAGKPKLANEHFEYYIEIDDVIKADFCLKVTGDSMINARIYDGDIVFIREQPDVEDGEIAAVRIDDEATLKRVYKMPGRIQLRAENPAYEPINITEEDGKDIEILGKAIAFQSKVR